MVKNALGKKQIDVAKNLAEKLEMRWYSGRLQDGSIVVTETELNNLVFLLKNLAEFADLANKWTPKKVVLDKTSDVSNQVLTVWMEDSLGNTKTCAFGISEKMALDFCVDPNSLLEMISAYFAESIFKPLLKEALSDFNKSIIQNASVGRSS